MSTEGPKQLLFDQFAAVGKALGHRHRLELLDVLLHGERNVDTLAARCGLSVANASQHLRQLHRAGLVSQRKVGTQVIYTLTDPRVETLLRTLWDIAESSVAEIERLLRRLYTDRDALEPVHRDELQHRLQSEGLVLIDVRPEEEYRAGHIPGAISIPLDDLSDRLSRLPKNQDIVACCRGRYCVYAYEAVEQLRRHGYRARRLHGGYTEWRAAGYPVSATA